MNFWKRLFGKPQSEDTDALALASAQPTTGRVTAASAFDWEPSYGFAREEHAVAASCRLMRTFVSQYFAGFPWGGPDTSGGRAIHQSPDGQRAIIAVYYLAFKGIEVAGGYADPVSWEARIPTTDDRDALKRFFQEVARGMQASPKAEIQSLSRIHEDFLFVNLGPVFNTLWAIHEGMLRSLGETTVSDLISGHELSFVDWMYLNLCRVAQDPTNFLSFQTRVAYVMSKVVAR